MRTTMGFLSVLLVSALALGQTYINGPFVTHPGQGPLSGTDASVQTHPTVPFGYGLMTAPSANLDNRVADDFTVPCGQSWIISTVQVFAFQRFAPVPTPSLSHANFRIWSGQPGTAGAVVLHDLSTSNQLLSSAFTNCYRVSGVLSTDTTRPIYDAVIDGNGIQLDSGTYWFDYQLGGSANLNGPWAPPVSIPGQYATGNAVQQIGAFTPALSAWQPVLNGYHAQDFPFVISYAMVLAPCWTLTLTQTMSGELTVANSGGGPGNVFFNAYTLTVGNFPNGAFFGLDISLAEILHQVGLGPPFTGTLDASGAHSVTIPSGIPSGLLLHVVALQGNGSFLQATAPFTYLTI